MSGIIPNDVDEFSMPNKKVKLTMNDRNGNHAKSRAMMNHSNKEHFLSILHRMLEYASGCEEAVSVYRRNAPSESRKSILICEMIYWDDDGRAFNINTDHEYHIELILLSKFFESQDIHWFRLKLRQCEFKLSCEGQQEPMKYRHEHFLRNSFNVLNFLVHCGDDVKLYRFTSHFKNTLHFSYS